MLSIVLFDDYFLSSIYAVVFEILVFLTYSFGSYDSLKLVLSKQNFPLDTLAVFHKSSRINNLIYL